MLSFYFEQPSNYSMNHSSYFPPIPVCKPTPLPEWIQQPRSNPQLSSTISPLKDTNTLLPAEGISQYQPLASEPPNSMNESAYKELEAVLALSEYDPCDNACRS